MSSSTRPKHRSSRHDAAQQQATQQQATQQGPSGQMMMLQPPQPAGQALYQQNMTAMPPQLQASGQQFNIPPEMIEQLKQSGVLMHITSATTTTTATSSQTLSGNQQHQQEPDLPQRFEQLSLQQSMQQPIPAQMSYPPVPAPHEFPRAPIGPQVSLPPPPPPPTPPQQPRDHTTSTTRTTTQTSVTKTEREIAKDKREERARQGCKVPTPQPVQPKAPTMQMIEDNAKRAEQKAKRDQRAGEFADKEARRAQKAIKPAPEMSSLVPDPAKRAEQKAKRDVRMRQYAEQEAQKARKAIKPPPDPMQIMQQQEQQKALRAEQKAKRDERARQFEANAVARQKPKPVAKAPDFGQDLATRLRREEQKAKRQERMANGYGMTTTSTTTTVNIGIGGQARQEAAAKGEVELQRFDQTVSQMLLQASAMICPSGYKYYRGREGYMCGVGNHFVSHASVDAMMQTGAPPELEQVNDLLKQLVYPEITLKAPPPDGWHEPMHWSPAKRMANNLTVMPYRYDGSEWPFTEPDPDCPWRTTRDRHFECVMALHMFGPACMLPASAG